MNEIYGELPNSPVVYAACDSKYFIDHAAPFVYSADDVGKALTYDTGTSSVRAMTAAEKSADFDAVTLSDAWEHLRNQRNIFLRDTDEYMASDRPATTNMPQYRAYLRGLPATYNDTSILSQSPVMDFDAYVAAL